MNQFRNWSDDITGMDAQTKVLIETLVLWTISILFFGALILLYGYFLKKQNVKVEEQLKTLNPKIHKKVKFFGYSNHWKIETEQGNYYFWYWPIRRTEAFYEISVPYISEIQFSIIRKPANENFQTGDAEFDRQFQVRTNKPEAFKSVFEKPEFRENISRLFQFNIKELSTDGQRIHFRLWHIQDEIDPQTLDDAGKVLIRIGNVISPQSKLPIYPVEMKSAFSKWTTIAIVLFAVGQVESLFVETYYRPISLLNLALHSTPYWTAAMIFFLFIAFKDLKARASTTKKYWLIGLFSLTGFLSAGIYSTALFNGMLDRSPVKQKMTSVVGKDYFHSKQHQTRYYLQVEDPSSPGEIKNVLVKSGEYNAATPQQSTVELDTRAGCFGFEWIESYRIRY